jgi:ribokinase
MSDPGEPGNASRVLIVGGINADLVIHTPRRPGPGETVLGDGYTLGYGGKGANQAVAAAAAKTAVEVDVVMIGAVGDDEWGRMQQAELQRFGVDVTAVQCLPGVPTGIAMIAVTPDGENSIIVAPGANHALTPEAVAGALAACGGGVVVAQCELSVDVIERAAAFARAADARLLINAAPVTDLSDETWAAADPLVVNEHEARDILRTRPGGPNVPADGIRLAEAVRTATKARSVVVTLGAQGAAIAAPAGARHIPGQSAHVVDTTGAGDTFVGTLAAQLASGSALDDAVRVAGAAAARSVTWHGTRPPPT